MGGLRGMNSVSFEEVLFIVFRFTTNEEGEWRWQMDRACIWYQWANLSGWKSGLAKPARLKVLNWRGHESMKW